MNKRNEKGYVLIVCLLLLLVLTVIGLTALGTSSLENMLSGNIRLRTVNIAKADGAVEIGSGLVQRAVREMDSRGYSNIVTDTSLPAELINRPFDPDTQDMLYTVAGQNVTVDIDKMYSLNQEGCSIEFAGGYEGGGKGGGGCKAIYYRINATGSDLASSQGTVGAVYRYVPN